jgi:hypothetical protein
VPAVADVIIAGGSETDTEVLAKQPAASVTVYE